MHLKKLTFLIVLLLSIQACKKSDDSSPAPVENKTINWYAFKQNVEDTIEVKNGYLYISTKYSSSSQNGDALISAKKIKGDFELRINFSSFNSNGINNLSEQMGFTLSRQGGSSPLYSGILNNNAIYIEDTVFVNTVSKPTNNKNGEFYVKRTGGDFIAWMRAGADTVKMHKVSYSTADLTLGISVASLDNTATHTSLHVDDFNLNGGGGEVTSDPFDENHIMLY